MPITLNNETISKLDSERLKRIPKLQENELYVKGKNPETMSEPQKKAPDNRITIGLAKMAVDSMSGFQGKIEVGWDNVTTPEDESKKPNNDPYISLRGEVSAYNQTEIENMELREQALTQGEAYELHWVSVDEDNAPTDITPEYKIVPNSEIVLIWSRDLKQKLEAFLRFQKYDDDCIMDAYYPLYSERWQKDKGTNMWMRNEEGDTQYPYKIPPLAIFPVNKDSESFFEPGKSLITGNDKMLNKSINEVDRFNAMIALLPKKVDKAFVDKLIELNVIDDLSDVEHLPQYMQKDLSGIEQFYSMVSKQVEKWFFDVLGIINLSDEKIQGVESGEALARKMLAMELVAAKIDMYFNKGIVTRNKLINDVLAEDSALNPDDYQIKIKVERNIPMDDSARVENAVKVFGTISKEDYLRALPKSIIPDVEKALERLEEEMPEIDLDNLSTDE